MSTEAQPPAGATPPPAIDGRASFVAALRWGFDVAIAGDARRIVCVDPGFGDWPWDDAALLAALTTWLRRPQRRLVLLARDFEALQRRCPRFNAWRVDWSHALEAWQPPEELARELPTVLVGEGGEGAVCVHLVDALHWRGRASLDTRVARQWCDELDALLQRAERALAVRTLGL